MSANNNYDQLENKFGFCLDKSQTLGRWLAAPTRVCESQYDPRVGADSE
jgi:hypothetical protein